LPGEKKKPAPLNPNAVLDSAAAHHAPHLAGPTDIRGAGQSGETRGAGGAKGASPSGGGDSSGVAQNDAGERQTAPSPAAGGSDDQMEGGEDDGEDEEEAVEGEEEEMDEETAYFYTIPDAAKKRIQEVCATLIDFAWF